MGGPARAETHFAVRRAQGAGQGLGAAERHRGAQRAPHPQVVLGSHGRLNRVAKSTIFASSPLFRNQMNQKIYRCPHHTIVKNETLLTLNESSRNCQKPNK